MDRRKRTARTVALMSLFSMTDTRENVPVASFYGDGSDLVSLIVGIDPVQAGSGDPSPDNVRPISGWAGVDVNVAGKNLLGMGNPDGLWNATCTKNEDGSITVVTTPSGGASVQYLLTGKLKSGTYTATNLSVSGLYVQNNASDYTHAVSTGDSYTFNYDGESYLRLVFANQTANTTETYKVQLELGSTATDYEPYNADTYSITFPSEVGTVYGGTLDVTTGKLTVDRVSVDMGSVDWGKNTITQGTLWRHKFDDMANAVSTIKADLLCSLYPTVPQTQRAENTLSANIKNVDVIDSSYSSAADFKTAMSGVQLVYPLATPIEVDLTPTEINTLLGTNNIWANTGEIKYIEYNV